MKVMKNAYIHVDIQRYGVNNIIKTLYWNTGRFKPTKLMSPQRKCYTIYHS